MGHSPPVEDEPTSGTDNHLKRSGEVTDSHSELSSLILKVHPGRSQWNLSSGRASCDSLAGGFTSVVLGGVAHLPPCAMGGRASVHSHGRWGCVTVVNGQLHLPP